MERQFQIETVIVSCLFFLEKIHVLFENASAKTSDQEQEISDVMARPFHHKQSANVPYKDLVLLTYNYRKLTLN